MINWSPQLQLHNPNDSKCNLLVCGNKEEIIIAKIGNAFKTETHEVKLLGTIIDRNLSFKKHTTIICKKAGKKLNAGFAVFYLHINREFL